MAISREVYDLFTCVLVIVTSLLYAQAPSVSSKHGIDDTMDQDGPASQAPQPDSAMMGGFGMEQGFNPQGFTQEQVDGKY